MQLAIIIPYYKITFFRETLDSLAAQTDQRFMVYIGNDASPENPEDLLKEFEGKFNFVYKKFEENLGRTSLTKHWDRCINMMQGEEWFMILGDDDYLSRKYIENFYLTVANDSSLHVLRCDVQVINEYSIPIVPLVNYPIMESSVDFIVKRAQQSVRSSLSEYVFRMEDYIKYGITAFPKAFYSDNMMVLEYSNFGFINKIENSHVYVRVSDLSLSGNKDNTVDLYNAGYLFYTNLLINYSHKFPIKAKTLFTEYMLAGQLLGVAKISFFTLFKIIGRNTGVYYTILFMARWAKFKFVHFLQ